MHNINMNIINEIYNKLKQSTYWNRYGINLKQYLKDIFSDKKNIEEQVLSSRDRIKLEKYCKHYIEINNVDNKKKDELQEQSTVVNDEIETIEEKNEEEINDNIEIEYIGSKRRRKYKNKNNDDEEES